MIGTPLHARVFKFQFCILLRPPSFFCPNSPTGPTFWHVSNRTPFTSTSLLSEPAKAIFLKNARIRVHKKQIRTMIIFTTEKDCDTKLSLTTLLPFLSSKFHSILSFLSSLNHLASYLFKGSSHIVRRKGKCVETYKIHKLYKIKTPLFLPRCWWWWSCSSPPMMLMTNMIHNDGDDHLTSAYDVASAQQPVSLLLPNGWKGFVDAEWMDRRPKGSFFVSFKK